MKLSALMESAGYERPKFEAEISDVVMDSRKVREGSLFIAVKGGRYDGHDMIPDAINGGAAAVVAERSAGLKNEIIVEDTRIANAVISAAYFDNPAKKLKLIGVTGTNGKTTVSAAIKQALTNLGHSAGLIGTIQCEIGKESYPSKFTTPEPWDLNLLFDLMVKKGCEYVVIEASSQALAQKRLYGLRFMTAVFTNLSHDHLDYHHTMEKYFKAKCLLFDMADAAVINADDEYGKRLLGSISTPAVSYSYSSNYADMTAKNIEYETDRVKFAVSGDDFIARVKFPMPGVYSVQNALAAVLTLTKCGFSKQQSADAVSGIKGIKGRYELIYKDDNFSVISDFAHTAEGLRALISSIKPSVRGRTIVLFGCAGDRDKSKREDMVRAVCELSDLAIVTADNPRTENAGKTIKSLLRIFEQTDSEYYAEPDREKAIRWALEQCRNEDILLLCGKGHEDYQVMDGYTLYLDEKQIVQEFFA